ncbi:MAG: Fe-S cluster assembly ATPase SufC, partial [Salinispira sp.]
MKIEITNLHANIEGKKILRGLNLTIKSGEIHAVMGPNGAGKSTLSHVIMGNPRYDVSKGEILLNGENLLEMEPNERARRGIFMAFQYPVEIPGITVGRFLKRAVEIRENDKVRGFIKNLRETMAFLDIDQQFINRYLNEGFSGGEKKRMEILQMLMLKPAFGILDETDSGLDIDALQVVAKGVNHLRGDNFAAIIITHYQRILNYIKPDYVHILYEGRIVKSGAEDLVDILEERGYNW